MIVPVRPVADHCELVHNVGSLGLDTASAERREPFPMGKQQQIALSGLSLFVSVGCESLVRWHHLGQSAIGAGIGFEYEKK